MAVGGGNTDVMWFVEQTAWVADSGREILAHETAVFAATRLKTAARREGGGLGPGCGLSESAVFVGCVTVCTGHLSHHQDVETMRVGPRNTDNTV